MSLACSTYIRKKLSTALLCTVFCCISSALSSVCPRIVSYTVSGVKYESAQVTVETCGAGAFFHEPTKNVIMKRRKRLQMEFWRATCKEIRSLSVWCIVQEAVQDKKTHFPAHVLRVWKETLPRIHSLRDTWLRTISPERFLQYTVTGPSYAALLRAAMPRHESRAHLLCEKHVFFARRRDVHIQ